MRILSAAELREVDQLTTERFHVPGLTLMENAGRGVAAECRARFPDLASTQILIVCGKGNNGGDGLVTARHLIQRGASPHVVLLAPYDQVHGDARVNLDALIQMGVRPTTATSGDDWSAFASSVPTPSCVIDAVLGTGATKPVQGFLAQVIEDIRRRFSQAFVISVDLPSGLNADSNEVAGPAIRADATVTMTAPKICLALPPAAELAGEVKIASIGSPEALVEEKSAQKLSWSTATDFPFLMRARPVGANKGAFGHCLIIAGSAGKSGAAALAGKAALRSGAGLVTVATSAGAQPLVAQSLPELMTIPLTETQSGAIDFTAFDYGAMDTAVHGKSVIAMGPGLSQEQSTQDFVRRVVKEYRAPMVIDADGLNAFVEHLDLLDGRERVLVLTPHPGEFARLIRSSAPVIQSARRDFAREFSSRHHVILVLKGFRTLVATPDGEVQVCPTGNPGMAKGGSGDVLTGMIAAFLSQFSAAPPDRAVAAAVFLHGRAGDYARDRFGEIAMLPGDLIECLPQVFADFVRPSSSHPFAAGL